MLFIPVIMVCGISLAFHIWLYDRKVDKSWHWVIGWLGGVLAGIIIGHWG